MTFKHDFIKCVDFIRIAQLKTQQAISSHIYRISSLIQTYHILVLIL